jgi:hypothetical protein
VGSIGEVIVTSLIAEPSLSGVFVASLMTEFILWGEFGVMLIAELKSRGTFISDAKNNSACLSTCLGLVGEGYVTPLMAEVVLGRAVGSARLC